MDRRIIKTKDTIKTTYKKILLEKKNAKITITELANKANIDRKTFYLHYNSIEDIMSEIIDENLSELELAFRTQNTSTDVFDTKLIIRTMNNCLIKDIDFYKTIVHRNDFQIFINELKERLFSTIMKNWLSNTMLSAEESAIYCKFLVSGITEVYIDWFLNESAMNLDELGEIIGHIIHTGVCTLSKK